MNCETARLEIGAEPGATSPALEEHLRSCPACASFRAEMRTLDANIRRALERPPEQARSRPRRPAAPWREWALAASVVLATLAVAALWLLRPSDTLARDVVSHVQHESDSWAAKEHVTAKDIDTALRGAGVVLDINSERISFAHSCWFRGHYVPHLVVQTTRGPATVMILRHEHVTAPRTFHEAGMAGVIAPAERGSIAVVTHDDATLGAVAGQMQHEVHWLPR